MFYVTDSRVHPSRHNGYDDYKRACAALSSSVSNLVKSHGYVILQEDVDTELSTPRKRVVHRAFLLAPWQNQVWGNPRVILC